MRGAEAAIILHKVRSRTELEPICRTTGTAAIKSSQSQIVPGLCLTGVVWRSALSRFSAVYPRSSTAIQNIFET
jgi:hypothetical protein